MKITIAGGAGAMGSIFGGRLAQSGEDVLLYDVSKSAVEAINDGGVRIVDKTGVTDTVPVRSTTSPGDASASDLVIIFTKCFHTEAAIHQLLPHLSAHTRILSLQNGWGNAPVISQLIGRENLLIGVNYVSGTILEPGRVRQAGNSSAYIGRWELPTDQFTQDVSAMISRAGIHTTATGSVMTEIWKKLCLNVVTLPVAALLRLEADKLLAHDSTRELMEALLREAVAVAQAQHIDLDYGERLNAITQLLKNAVGAKGSMLQDAEAHRQTEIDVINGAIVEAGRRAAIATPYNQSMVWLIHSMEGNYNL